MNFELTETQRSLQREARAFAEREVVPHAARWDSASVFPRETIFRAGQLGLCGLYAEERHGGRGRSRLDATIAFEELAAACPSTAAFITIHNMAAWVITQWASADVAARWARQLTSGRSLASYCLTEPHAGSDAASLSTTATRDGHEFVLDGTKAFVSGAGATDALLVLARTGEAGPRGVSAFLVPADTKGVTFGRDEDKLGWHSQPTRSITFDGVRVPRDHLLGEEGEGFRIAMKGLDGERVNIATCSVGAAQAALDASRRYMNDRRQFGRPLASFQALQFKLADMATELVAARQMVRFAATKLDRDSPDATVYAAMAKRVAPTRAFASATRRSRSTVATATRAGSRSSGSCVTPACIRSSAEPTRSCA
ncbi:MAG: acyl-CoA dehydrogenase family protein [Labilithrix sp.]|nr:acyl-CoA dehydrogenase family protein [Labilithrix sp.]